MDGIMRLIRLLVWGMPATVGVTAVLCAVVAYVPPLRVLAPGSIIVCGVSTMIYLVVAIICTVCAERRLAPRLMRSGLIVGLVGLLAMYAALVLPAIESFIIWPLMWGMLVGSIGLLLLPRRRPGWWLWARDATIVLVAVLAAVICLAVSDEIGLSWQRRMIVARLGWSVAFLTAGAAAATMLGVWIPGLAAPPVGSTTPRPYRLRCPRCGTGQEAVTGEHHCSGCGLKIQVDVA